MAAAPWAKFIAMVDFPSAGVAEVITQDRTEPSGFKRRKLVFKARNASWNGLQAG